jgi:hypothetical protein
MRDKESQYTEHKDPLTLRTSQRAELRLFELAETARRNENLDLANRLYQVAIDLALACDDRDETENNMDAEPDDA